jgi:hypothetical protein
MPVREVLVGDLVLQATRQVLVGDELPIILIPEINGQLVVPLSKNLPDEFSRQFSQRLSPVA